MTRTKKSRAALFIITASLLPFITQCALTDDLPGSGKTMITDYDGTEKIEVEYSLEDDFADDTIIVGLTHKASMSIQKGTVVFKEYTIKDFPEIKLESVKDLSEPTNNLIIKQYKASVTGDWSEIEDHVSLGMLLDIDNYTRILLLTLKEEERSKENILKAVDLLNKRSDVWAAEPNFYEGEEFDDILPCPPSEYYSR